MVDWKCSPGSLTSTISCLCCLYMLYRPLGFTRKLFKAKGVPLPLNVTIMLCLVCCCMSSSGVTLVDCSLQYAGLKSAVDSAIAKAIGVDVPAED